MHRGEKTEKRWFHNVVHFWGFALAYVGGTYKMKTCRNLLHLIKPDIPTFNSRFTTACGLAEKSEGLSPELQAALEPLLAAIESVSERIAEYNERIEKLEQESYPQVGLLKQVKGVGTLIGLTSC
jgi:transposase